MTLMFTGPAGSGVKPLALIAVTGPPPKFRIAPGNDCVGSFAATLTAPTPEAGEPVMYGFEPWLPDEAMTMTPDFAAFVEATAAGSSGLPNGEPSDMLMTSMSLSTAHSI